MNALRIQATVMLLVGTILGGCTSVYWDKDWQYVGTQEDVPMSQSVTIRSDPPGASVFLNDGKHAIGTTPMPYEFAYAEVRTELAKKQYQDESGTKTVLDTQSKVIEATVSKPYVITLSREGFSKERRTLIVPLALDTVYVRLRESGLVEDIACSLLIEARSEYFGDIDKIIMPFAGRDREFSAGEKLQIAPETPDLTAGRAREIKKLNDQSIRVYQYNIKVDDSDAFSLMVSELRALASDKDYAFEIYDADYNAKFTTNILKTAIRHIVTGRRRSGAKLYLVRRVGPESKAKPVLIPQAAFTGDRFSTEVEVDPKENYVYLISAFKKGRAVLLVFEQLDVFNQTRKEIKKLKDFTGISGVSDQDIERIRASLR